MRFKRFFDVTVSLVVLVLLSPVFVPILIAVAVFHGRPVLFTQQRVGRYGQPFRILKLRSMTNERDEHGNLLPDELRMTTFGSILRKSSLDELPALINVIKGDMSLVGPRPLLNEYHDLYTPDQYRRHDVRGGITGLAQVKGRNSLSWEEKFAYDIEYIDNMSFWLDLKIMWWTVFKVASSEGVAQEGVATAERFEGSRRPARRRLRI